MEEAAVGFRKGERDKLDKDKRKMKSKKFKGLKGG